jgi:GT2 family glycosyltransferase
MIGRVIIPILNRFDLLERCVASLPAEVDVLVIDNGSCVPGSFDSAQVTVLRVPSNLGVAGSWNLGIKLYPREPGWLLLNSDAWFAEDAFDVFDREAGEDRILLAGSPAWCCAWIGAGVVKRVGLFCEAFYPAYMEDLDFEERAKRLNAPVVYSSAVVHHDNSSTIASSNEFRSRNDATHEHARKVFDARWRDLAADDTPAPMEWSLDTRRMNSWD